jgi:hypothetical protein
MRPPFGGLVLVLALNYSAIDSVLCHRLSHRRFFLPNRQPLAANRYHLVIRMPLYDKWPPRQSFLV